MGGRPIYQCAECGLAVAITPDGDVIRGCKHERVAIVANMGARCEGAGSLKQAPPKDR